MHNNSLAM